VFGVATEDAVRRFQGQQGIAVDGVVGPDTWSRLFITVRRGSTGEAVKAVQLRMNLRQADPIAVDADFGPLTEQAVREFQLSSVAEKRLRSNRWVRPLEELIGPLWGNMRLRQAAADIIWDDTVIPRPEPGQRTASLRTYRRSSRSAASKRPPIAA
jgi:hypothetical protein